MYLYHHCLVLQQENRESIGRLVSHVNESEIYFDKIERFVFLDKLGLLLITDNNLKSRFYVIF